MRRQVIVYLASVADPQRVAVGPVLAALAHRSGIEFECYHDAPRRGLHFGSGDPADAAVGAANGGLPAGGRHIEQLRQLATGLHVLVLGDPESAMWPALVGTDAEVLAQTTDPAVLFASAFERLGEPLPSQAYVLDDAPQGRFGIRTAAYLASVILSEAPSLAVEASASPALQASMSALGVTQWRGLWVDPARAAAFPVPLDAAVGDASAETYAAFTSTVARSVQSWGKGVFLGDPDLAAAQLGRIAGRRLVAVYGRPHVDVISRLPDLIREADEPVFGRQYDDRDFLELAALGHGLQVVDPDPPYESARHLLPHFYPASAPVPEEPSDAQLAAWADEGRVLVTLCLWSGMVREVDCLARLIDLAALTGLHAGLVVTAETVELPTALDLLAVPPARGGVAGQLELLLGSTGRGVAAEGLMPAGSLQHHLSEARTAMAARLPGHLLPRGWWPLLDTNLARSRPTVVRWAGLRPAVQVSTARSRTTREEPPSAPSAGRVGMKANVRNVAGHAVRRTGLSRFLAERRPFDGLRPGHVSAQVMREVEAAGFSYMWTKAGFGAPKVVGRHDGLIAIPFTAGNWDGWSPFYTVGNVADVARAEHRLLRSGAPGWLASTVDSPLFALSGEIWRHGTRLHDLVSCVAGGGRSGRLVNVRPHVVARYARLLDQRSGDSNRLGPCGPLYGTIARCAPPSLRHCEASTVASCYLSGRNRCAW